jgi:hypothetical protein
MKVVCFIACLALVAAEIPRISLDLDESVESYKLATPISRKHDLGYKQPNGVAVKSRQDWTQKCRANLNQKAGEKNCPFPQANAFDHQDSTVPVQTRVILVDQEGKTKNKRVKKVDFTKRSTYLFKFDAKDNAGNYAEQVVFALIIDDPKAPRISMCGDVAETVEAASGWKLCASSSASDNIDGKLTSSIKYTVLQVATKTYLVRDGSLAQARKAITTHTVGRFLVTLKVADKAGLYGHDSRNNVDSVEKAVLVKDTRKPWIQMHGASPDIHECAIRYVDARATAHDMLDTRALKKVIKIATTTNVNAKKIGGYRVTYDCSDFAGNKATRQVRKVKVVDTTKPVIKLVCPKVQIVHAGTKVSAIKDRGVKTTDTCDKNLRPVKTKWEKKFDDRVVGTYMRTYTVKDAAGNKNEISRTFVVVDKKAPEIKIIGKDSVTLEANRDVEYTDQGATCKDYVDGVLSHAVEVSGKVVNMRVPGKYTIRYDCADLSGNAATPVTRVVIVRDTRCPKLKLKGSKVQYVEAGFAYTDQMASATDSLDGDLSAKVTSDGDTVNVVNAFYSRRSCNEIKKAFPGIPKTGKYYITSYVESRKEYRRVLVWCDMSQKVGAFTYFPITYGKRVGPKQAGDCAKYGLERAYFKFSGQKKRALAKFGTQYINSASSSDDYICSTNDFAYAVKDLDAGQAKQTLGMKHSDITHAEAGKYVVSYHVQDKAKNKECSSPVRTVIVKDTLPPVIQLKLNTKVIHRGDYTQTGLNGVKQPTKKWFGFMAESSSVNGWAIAAIASAVTGVALLGMAGGKQVAVSVPV